MSFKKATCYATTLHDAILCGCTDSINAVEKFKKIETDHTAALITPYAEFTPRALAAHRLEELKEENKENLNYLKKMTHPRFTANNPVEQYNFHFNLIYSNGLRLQKEIATMEKIVKTLNK